MDYKIIELSWYKRRINTENKKEIINIDIKDFKKERFSFCNMIVTFKEETVKLTGQVIHNTIKDIWLINGIDSQGNQVVIEILN